MLHRNKGDTLWQTSNGEVITEQEKELYLSKAILVENVSKQFRIENGKAIRIK